MSLPTVNRQASPHRAAPCATVLLPIALLLMSAPAQAITLDTDVGRDDKRSSSELPYVVSYDDCVRNNRLILTLTDLTVGDTLSVWSSASSDCTDLETRNDELCTELVSAFQLSDTSLTLAVDANTLAASLSNVSGCVDEGAVDEPRAIVIYFLVDETSDPVEEYATYETEVDLLGPDPPTDLAVAVADDDALLVGYSVDASSTDTVGYELYCEALGDGTAGSGSIGGSSTKPDCQPTELVTGEPPPASLAPCGSTQSETEAMAEGLTSTEWYAVGVAAHDQVGNVGPLSDIVCGMPEPVDDFYELYRKAGGQAGGGYCAYSGHPLGVGSERCSPWLLATGFSAAILHRRRQRCRLAPAAGSPLNPSMSR